MATEEELDALVKRAMDLAIERLQKLHAHAGRTAWDQVICEELSEPFTTLRAQLAEARADRDEWKKAATARHPNPADHRYWEGRYRDEKDRADRAEAALAAQIEVDAGIEWVWYGQDENGKTHVSLGRWQRHPCQLRYKLAEIQPTEHDKPHDRTALERHDAKTREKTLREAAEILDEEG